MFSHKGANEAESNDVMFCRVHEVAVPESKSSSTTVMATDNIFRLKRFYRNG